MSITQQTIEKIAKLAQIAITDTQRQHLHDDLNNIIQLLEKIDGLNVSNVTPLLHPFDHSQPLREDVISEHNERDAFQKIAPNVHFGLYIVPKVIE